MAGNGEATANSQLSISALARLTGLDRRTVTDRLATAGLEPVATYRNSHLYRVGTALPILFADERSPFPGEPDVKELDLREKQVRVAKMELEYHQSAGRLVDREDVEKIAFNVARLVRDRFMKLADKLSPELATMSDTHGCRELLLGNVREILEEVEQASSTGGQE